MTVNFHSDSSSEGEIAMEKIRFSHHQRTGHAGLDDESLLNDAVSNM